MQSTFVHNCFLCLFFLFFFFTEPVKAQYQEKDFIHYTVKQGLSDNYITCLQQDSQGYMWAGTSNGLNRFDGNSFKNFYQGTSAIPLLSNAIRNLKIFNADNLAIIGRGGFQLLNTRNFSLQNFSIADSTAFTPHVNNAWDVTCMPNQSYGVTTASGFYVFNKTGNINFRHDAYYLNDIGKKRIFYGRDIFVLNNNEYLIYAEATGLVYYNAEKKLFRNISTGENEWKTFAHPTAAKDNYWLVKHQLSNHEFIFIHYRKDSIVYYDFATKKNIASPLPFHPSIEFNWQSNIVMLSDSVFAINGGSYGFYIFHLNRQTGNITCDGKKLMPAYKITSLFADKEKRLWLGTNEGLLQQKLNSPFISSFRYPPATGQTLTGGFNCTYRYKSKLYAGRNSLNAGLTILNAADMKAEKQIEFYGGNNSWNEIISMEMYHPDTLWIGTNAGLLWFDTHTGNYGKVLDKKKYAGFNTQPVMLAPAREDGYAWFCYVLEGVAGRYHIATRSFTFFTLNTKPALPFDKVKSIAYDSYGDVWIGGHSLCRWNNRLQFFDTLITVYGGANKFNDDILTLSADANGSLWMHNAYNGLLEYRIKEKKFVPYTMKGGLPSEVLTSFSPVIDNTLWIGSNNYLTRFDTRTKKFITYDETDGLPAYQPTGRRIYYDHSDNSLYMCSNEYLVKFPLLPNSDADNSSDLIIQELLINNKNSFFAPANELHLKYNENNLTINYAIIDYEKNNYQFTYKLNSEADWNNLGNQRGINLNNLQPGKYAIQLRATGKTGNEKLKTFTFFIQPPFWKTTWFLILCGLLATGAIFYLYKKRIQQVKQKADIDKLLAQTEMKAFHAQMNPHFIFNSLNSIREMILHNENKDASHYLSKFAHLIRITLDQSTQTFISLRSTLDYLQRYIEMEQIRNGNFTCTIYTDDTLDLDETLLPPMLIQPFVENAIWHGTTASCKKININIQFKKTGNRLLCSIDDNGIGINQSVKNKSANTSPHHSVGIANIKNRFRLLNEKYNLQCSISITDKKDLQEKDKTGTLIILHLPIEINKNE